MTFFSPVLPDFLFENPYFLNFFQGYVQIYTDFFTVYGFCTDGPPPFDIRPLFSVRLLL